MTNSPPQEIELKLTLPPAQAAAFLARMARRRVVPVAQTLHTRYFDTPDFDLSAAGVALRVRRSGRRWVQTLKTEGTRGGGLSTRPEFEVPVARGEPDWAKFPPEALVHVPAVLRDRLLPAFETRFERLSWHLKLRDGSEIEVALDRGAVHAGKASEPLCEIELELKRGPPAALFALARPWAAAFGCLPNDASKAARGVRLARGQAAAPVKTGALALQAELPLETAFAMICRHALAHFQANLPGVFESDDVEYVHQARVALRRLRAALRLARQTFVLPTEQQDGLRALVTALGPARDWDVLCLETWPPIAARYPDVAAAQAETARLEAQRSAVRATMRADLAAAQPGAWLLAIQQSLLAHDAQSLTSPQAASTLGPWARAALRRGQRALLCDARRFATLDAEARHRVRIRVKRYRYALEFLASLLPKRATARQLEALRIAQDTLGRANDAQVANVLLRSLPGADTPVRAFVLGWLAAEAARIDLGENAKTMKNFVKLRIDW